jgi:hypothetical protein
MATSAVDRNNNAEVVSRNREQAKAQEAALKKRHAEEVNKLSKQYGEKVRELQKSYEEQMDKFKTRGQESLTEKDKKYQSEIDKIKNTHSQQAKNTAQNYERQIKEQRDTYRDESKRTNKIHDTQMNELSKNYENDVEKREENYTKSAEEMRADMAKGLNAQHERLESKYSNDAKNMRETTDEKINELSTDLQDTRDQKNAEIKNLKVESLANNQEQEKDKIGLVTQERKTQGMIQENMRDQYYKNLDELRDKYSRSTIESGNSKAAELQNMKDDVTLKTKEQIGNIERREREVHAQNDNDKYLALKNFNQEKKNYMNASKEALDKSEMQKSMIYDSVNDRTAHEIKGITAKHTEILDNQATYYKDRLGEREAKYDEAVETQVKGLEIENRKDKLTLENRQQKLVHILGKEKNEVETYYKDVLSEKDRIHKEEMTEQRVKLTKEKTEAVSKLENRIRDIDAKNNEKITQLINRFETQIDSMKEEHKAEKKRLTDQANRRLDEVEKTGRFQLESEKETAKTREEQMKAKFENNISQMEERHDQEKIRIATSVKK